MAFVIVDAAFKDDDGFFAGFSIYKLATVANYFGNWEMRDRRIVNSCRPGQNLVDDGQSATHDDRNLGCVAGLVKQIISGLLDRLVFHSFIPSKQHESAVWLASGAA